MRQAPFEAAHAPEWAEYRALLGVLEGRGRWRARGPAADAARFPALYRRLCAHYALARTRGYGPGLIDELHDLVQRGYPYLYRRRGHWLKAALGFMAADFPRTVRRQWRVAALAAALLVLPGLAMGLACARDAALIGSLLDAEQVAELESMYETGARPPGRLPERAAATDFMMFGYYVMNNVGIGFRTFGAGVLFGLGSAVILVYNGLFIGAAAGHLTRLGLGANFWTFVSGHSPFELTAVALCGAAGLLLGRGLLAPGRRTRAAALRAEAREAVVLAGGAGLMLVLAAVLEAYWSAGAAAPGVKIAVGVLGWVAVGLYLAFSGFRSESDSRSGPGAESGAVTVARIGRPTGGHGHGP